MSSQKNTTTGRALIMASMGAGIAGSYFGYLLQRAFLGEEKGKIKLKSTHIRAARRMANEMQALRGPAMKLGQMLSLQTGVLPDEILAELATLQMEAPGMHPSLVRAQVKGSLGREPEEILEDFLARRPSQRLRNQLGAHLFELFHFQVYKVEAIHADPHWGNYLFNDDAGISLVDFGCVKYLSPESAAYLRSVCLYPGSTGSADFRRLLETYYEQAGETLLPGARRALIRFADNFYRTVYPPEPGQHQLFDFGDATFLRDYLRE